jgi:hypothetical protein
MILLKGENITMNQKEMEAQIISQYQRDEHMMILVFAQWCVNHDLNPEEVYKRAYPQQGSNDALHQAIELTVPKEEAGEISDETLLGVLSLFGNEDLAFVVNEEMMERKKKRKINRLHTKGDGAFDSI